MTQSDGCAAVATLGKGALRAPRNSLGPTQGQTGCAPAPPGGPRLQTLVGAVLPLLLAPPTKGVPQSAGVRPLLAWCSPGPSHVLLPAGLFLRCDARFGHPVPRRAKRWASKMPALVPGDQSSRPHSGDRQPAPSQPRVGSAGRRLTHPVHVLAFPRSSWVPEGDSEVGRGLAGCRVLGQENPQNCRKRGDRQGCPERWPATAASMADYTPDPGPPFLAQLSQGTGGSWHAVASTGGTANPDTPPRKPPSPQLLLERPHLPPPRSWDSAQTLG